ncbi:MAG: phage tail sheath subtilisin-like domain-containing protein [Nitrospirota bacterium]|nr:phage tail sheath subtilisin-like domain-containing protein [Nitrospirota bacterium]
MSKGIYFGARSIVKPGAYSVVNASEMVPNRLGAANTIAVIGQATGGKPRTFTKVGSPADAASQLRSGVLLDVMNNMYDPSNEVPGAGDVLYYRLNLAVQAALSVLDAGAVAVLNLTAKDYGVHTNQIRTKIEAGSISGKKITINDVLDTVNYEMGDNLGNAFSLQYTGALFACRLSITKTGDVATALLLQTQAASGADPWVTMASVDLTNSSLATMGMLTRYLAGLQSMTVTILGDSNEPVGDLDAVSNQNVKSAAYTATANIGAIVNWVNRNSQLMTAARVASAVNVPANVGYTFMTGGSEGAAPSNSDWQAALDALLSVECNLVFVCSESAAIHAMALSHCNTASDVKARKERMCFVGGARGETVSQVVTRAQGLAGARSVLCYPGVNQIDLLSGNIVNRSSLYTAALVCGMAGGIRPEIPLTFKTVNGTVQGLETDLQLADIETLLTYGVLPVEHVASDGIFRIVQGITTYLVDDNVIWRKVAGVRIADYLNSQVRKAVSRYIGRVADQRTVTSILNTVVSTLSQLTRSATNQTGVLTAGNKPDGSPEPAFKNVQAVFDGFDLVAVSYMAHPVGEVGYITITAGLTPTQIVAN